MKKMMIMFVSLILVFFCSCAKVDDMREPNLTQESEVVFNSAPVSNNAPTKGLLKSPVHTKGDMTENFGVFGYVHPDTYVSGGYLMKNAEYVVSTGLAANGAKYYWPKADNLSDIKVNFVALYPYSTTAYALDANDTVTYSLATTTLDSVSSVDVLWATRYQVSPVNRAFPQANDSNDAVSLHFKHALSLVEFWAKKADGQNITKVEVTKVEFLDGSDAAAEIHTDGTLKIYAKKNDAANEAAYVPTFALGSTTVNNFNFAVNNVKDSLLGGASWAYPANALSSAIIIPQAVPAKVKITFNITITNGTDAIVYSGRTVTRTINTGTSENSQTYVANWESGKRYIYRFYISADDVQFDVTVDDWTDGNSNPFDVWDHNETAYVERFFDKASTMQA